MKVLFIHNALHSFVRVDRAVLGLDHQVDELVLDRPGRLRGLFGAVRTADLVYVWFAGPHAIASVAMARCLAKPVVLVLGGYDAADLVAHGSATYRQRVRRLWMRSLCRLTSALIVNSRGDLNDVRNGTTGSVPVHLVYSAFPAEELPYDRNGSLVLSVGTVSAATVRRKGYDALARAAALLPHARFVLAGRCVDAGAVRLRRSAPPNFEVSGYLSAAELEALLSRGSVYVQLSPDEGFGYALADALMHGCVPVVPHESSLRELLGEHAVYLRSDQVSELAAGIAEALARPSDERRRLVAHVERNFPVERRREALRQVLLSVGA